MTTPEKGFGRTVTTKTGFLVGGSADCFKVSISVRGGDLDPEEISRLLGCAPDASHRKGEPRKRGVPFKDGLWALQCTGTAGAAVEELITGLLDKLPQAPDVWEAIGSQFLVSVDIGVFIPDDNRDVSISHKTVRRLAVLGAAIWIDAYCTSDEREEKPEV
jgi:hypothetical protein